MRQRAYVIQIVSLFWVSLRRDSGASIDLSLISRNVHDSFTARRPHSHPPHATPPLRRPSSQKAIISDNEALD